MHQDSYSDNFIAGILRSVKTIAMIGASPKDVVDVFRGSDALPGIVDEILALEDRPDVLWAQLTVFDAEAGQRAEDAGLKVVMNRCPKIEYGRLSGEIRWSGVNSRIISSRKPVAQSGFQALGIRPQSK